MNANEVGTHLSHCYQDEYPTTCKYGDADCPAKPRREIMRREQQWQVFGSNFIKFPDSGIETDVVIISDCNDPADEVAAVYGKDQNDAWKQAELIVTAVNSHEKLIEGLREARAEAECGKNRYEGEGCADYFAEIVDKVDAALASAEAGSEWSGSPDPTDPDNYWIDDNTGERVNAATGERTAATGSTTGSTTGSDSDFRFKVGQRVYWTDPENLTSGYGVIEKINGEDDPNANDDTVISLRMDDGGEVEAVPHELTDADAFDRETEELTSYDYRNEQEADRTP